MTREEIIIALQDCVAKLGRVPRREEFGATSQVKQYLIRKYFSSFTNMLSECGFKRQGSGVPLTLESMFLDWARVVRSAGKIPTVRDYDQLGTYSTRPYMSRFKHWRGVPAGMLSYMVEKGLGDEWQDVMNIIAEHLKAAGEEATKYTLPFSATLRRGVMDDRPVYGQPMQEDPLTFAPTNEAGVLAAFACHARSLGMVIQRLQAEFPDCEAMREMDQNRWQRVRIEFEFESRNFLGHRHSVKGCDLIVCWINNWPECPLEVIELQSVLFGKK